MKKLTGLQWSCLILPAGPLVLWVAGALLINLLQYPQRQGAKKAQCRALISGFIAGLKAYQTEYSHFPADALDSPGPHALHRTRGAIMKALHPEDGKIDFFDPPPAKNRTNGLYHDEHGEPILVDPWGEPLYFAVDLKNEGEVPNPDSNDNKAHPHIPTDVIVFSAGPDHDPNTWNDNIASWK